MSSCHDQLVQSQFGNNANAYVASKVHASGNDLDWIAALAKECHPAAALDLGAGGGHVSYALAPFAGRVVACDLSPEMCAAVDQEASRRNIGNITTRTAPAEGLPFSDAQFDFLACRFSAHHWLDIGSGLAEARRVLRAGAPAVFVDIVAPTFVPADTHLQAVELLRDPSHVRDYSVREWDAMLKEAGFTVSASSTARLRMDFASWTERMRTPPDRVAAIHTLQALASKETKDYFSLEDNGSFTIDMVIIEAH